MLLEKETNQKIRLQRKLILNQTGLRIELEQDFVRYYRWLVQKYFYDCIKTSTPMHGAHISIVTKKLHKEKFDIDKLKKYHNLDVEFEYNINMKIGGNKFTNFWLPVNFELGYEIKKEIGIIESNFLGFHITVANTKNSGEKL